MSTTSEGCPTKAAHGTFCWNERLCWDVERAKKFYADAIGWTFTSMPTPTGETYWCAMQDTARRRAFHPHLALLRRRAGRLDVLSRGRHVDRRVAKATAAGAKLLRPIFDVPNVGRIAILDEPGGAGGGWMTPAA